MDEHVDRIVEATAANGRILKSDLTAIEGLPPNLYRRVLRFLVAEYQSRQRRIEAGLIEYF